jgi:hypothetical protein
MSRGKVRAQKRTSSPPEGGLGRTWAETGRG